MKAAEDFCRKCHSRDICSSLCPEAELYVNQDYVLLKEKTVGIPTYSRPWPNRLANITPKVHLSSKQIDRIIRKLKRYKNKHTKVF
jgi:hypothetical protein